jgi:predicted protein tyrosine phosphatase
MEEQDPYLMNRLGNCHNRFQNFAAHKRVVCVCSAGLLRSPTAAVVLSQAPWQFNTRAVGLVPEFALIPLDQVLLEWAEEFVCMTQDQADAVKDMVKQLSLKTQVTCLNISDNFGYREPELVRLIVERYTAAHSLD